MAGLDNILAKIKDDAEKKADVIIKEAQAERDSIIASGKDKGRKAVYQILRTTREERNNILMRASSQAKLKARDMIISAKQSKIDDVLKEVLTELNNLSDDEFVQYIKNNLKDVDLNTNDILDVPSKYKEAVKNANLGITVSDNETENGFKLHKDNVLYNGDFKSILESSREDLEKYIAEELFSN